MANNAPRFSLGRVLATPAALAALEAAGEDFSTYLSRHQHGDWGELDNHDRKANEDALKFGNRLLSSYRLKDGTKIWIITEAQNDAGYRTATTCLLPSDY